jgi:hypothetical protein
MKTGNSLRIREYARREIIEPARKRGDSVVRIVAGDVQRALHLHNLSKQVCDALKTKEFLKENRLALEKQEGPPKMASTTVTYTFRLLSESPTTRAAEVDPLLRLKGIGREVFKSLGGGEAFIRHEREHFYDSGEDS